MNKTLVVMAAGMGSRFGGLKQITPIDDDGNFIIDYSVYDAKRAGFSKVVFVIKEENFEVFKNTIGNRIKGKIDVAYAFQKMEDTPILNERFRERVKPWGTVQAILAARPYVDGSFVVINADDFYGSDAYVQASTFLDEENEPYSYACIAYPFGVTKSLEGAVKRGVLSLDNDKITSIIESSISVTDHGIVAAPLSGGEEFSILEDAPVSMNIFAFQNDAFEILEDYWNRFFKQDEEILLQKEALLPECLEENLMSKRITIYNRPSHGIWIGMTYKSDLDIVKEKMIELKKNGEYPEHLWED